MSDRVSFLSGCSATSADSDPWYCTLPSGHTGSHEAWGRGDEGTPFATWPNEHDPLRVALADLLDVLDDVEHRESWTVDARYCIACARPWPCPTYTAAERVKAALRGDET